MLILLLPTPHLKRILTSALIHFENTEKVEGLSKTEFKRAFISFYKRIFFLMESSTSKSMELPWVHPKVRHWLML